MQKEKTKTFRDLIVWQKSKELAVVVYRLTEKFPATERYGLSDQMRRAAISISSNIAEGYNRFHGKEKKQFLSVAFGSGAELESQVEIAKEIYPQYDYKKTEYLCSEIVRMLNVIISRL
jgi:four helix bundle protein